MKEIEVWVKREDLIHPEIMGNKWRKLKYNLLDARAKGKKTLITKGGAYSNHIAATAAAAKAYGFEALGIIRGQELLVDSNLTLKTANKNGMKLQFVDRASYKEISEITFHLEDGDFFIPEGGTNSLAIQGVSELVQEIDDFYDIIATSIGTGGTLCGLLKGLEGNCQILGFSSLKGDFMIKEIEHLRQEFNIPWKNYHLDLNYHFGGYGKVLTSLVAFINEFKAEFGISLDPIYTGKMFYGVWDKVKNDQIAKGSRILLLHTGGLQGASGFNARFPESAISI